MLIFLIPGFFSEVVRTSRRYGPSFGLGIVFLCVTPIVAILVGATIVGLGLGIATLLLWFIAVYSAQTFVGARIGEWLPGSGAGSGATRGRLALGLLLLHVFELVPYHVRGIIMFVVWMWGLGAIVLTIYHRLRAQPAPAQ